MSETHVVLSGSERPRRHDAQRVGDIDPSAPIEVTVTLRGPAMPDITPGHSISREQFEREHAASAQDVATVQAELERYGLTIDEASAATRSLRVSGTAQQMEQAFHAGLGVYENATQGRFRGREGTLEIPAGLDGLVTGVFGLDQRRVARRRPGIPEAHANAATVAASALSPADLEQRYRFPPGDGAGQTVAIAEFGGAYFPDDLTQFCAEQGRPEPTVKQVGIGVHVLTEQQVMALPEDQRQEQLDMSGEVNMDVQIVAGLAPGAEIVVYFAQFTQKGWIDLVDALIKGRPASPVAVSISWGLAEDAPDFSPAAVEAINERLQAAAAIGITICVASGDDGSGDQVDDGRAHVDFPASSPYVLAVGGTMIEDEADVVWFQPPGVRRDGGGSTGGGVSVRFDRPAWQVVDVEPVTVNEPSIEGRVVPDIAALAGPPYYQLVFQGESAPNGGTSASAPLWASLIARVESVQDPPASPVFLTPLLYTAGPGGEPKGKAVCVDVTKGHNTTPQPGEGFDAGPGFDAVSGWGVPDGERLLTLR
jgi:kumamolisin